MMIGQREKEGERGRKREKEGERRGDRGRELELELKNFILQGL